MAEQAETGPPLCSVYGHHLLSPHLCGIFQTLTACGLAVFLPLLGGGGRVDSTPPLADQPPRKCGGLV